MVKISKKIIFIQIHYRKFLWHRALRLTSLLVLLFKLDGFLLEDTQAD